jgi:membrane protein implicated in regulation of membrane protease activity
VSGSPLDPVVHLFTTLALVCVSAAVITLSAVSFLRWMGLHWSWTAPGVLAGVLLLPFDQQAAGFVVASAFATATGARWHADDLRRGGDQAQDARDRRTMLDAHRERRGRRGRWVDRKGLAVGTDLRGRTVRIPAGGPSGRHTLVVGATGSGNTVTQAWIAGRLIHAGHGAVVIDPKGDALLRDELEHAARKQRRMCRAWTRRAGGL